MTRKSVQGGHCTYPDDENCALERQGCNDSTNFLSSREMQNGPGMAHGGSCRWQDSVKDTKLGKCNSSSVSSENSNNNENNNNDYSEGEDYYHCSPNAESCQSESESAFTTTFISNNNGNNSNDNCMVENTFFGRCNSDLRCAWSPKDCDDNENEDNNDVSHIDNKSNNDFWTFPMIDCTCDNVQVGACSNKDADLATIATEEIFCAVSSDGCDGMQTWIRPTEVMGVAGFDCYLCRETSTTILTTTAPPAISTTDTDTDTDTTDNSNSSSSSSNSSSNNMNDNDYNINNNNSGLITGVVLGTIVILSIVGFVGRKLVNNRNRSCTSNRGGGGGGAVVVDNDGFVYGYGFGKEQSSNEPPTTAVELSSESYGSGNDKHAHQRTKMDLGDNVSVLSDD
mmetsp:Transcript_21732/g.25097  ORF Transcript_21732/g.25097 Transcript_21732/m.25097 type:complete len:397 (+) Transcript_21732:88-1278(+)